MEVSDEEGFVDWGVDFKGSMVDSDSLICCDGGVDFKGSTVDSDPLTCCDVGGFGGGVFKSMILSLGKGLTRVVMLVWS